MSAWSPERYLRFRAQRRQPYEDLAGLVRRRPQMRIVDLGCGPGELSLDLANRFDAGSVLGVDDDPAMLERASSIEDPRLRFVASDIRHADPGEVDLVFSNAALHWVPDHPALFRRLASFLSVRGQLAVQMPNNFGQPTHTIAARLAAEPPFAGALHGMRSGAAVLSAEAYAHLLGALGFREQVVREQIYLHRLDGPESVLEWVAGSMLTWYAARLGDQFAAFRSEYERRLLAALGNDRPFPLTYRRVLLWASR